MNRSSHTKATALGAVAIVLTTVVSSSGSAVAAVPFAALETDAPPFSGGTVQIKSPSRIL